MSTDNEPITSRITYTNILSDKNDNGSALPTKTSSGYVPITMSTANIVVARQPLAWDCDSLWLEHVTSHVPYTHTETTKCENGTSEVRKSLRNDLLFTSEPLNVDHLTKANNSNTSQPITRSLSQCEQRMSGGTMRCGRIETMQNDINHFNEDVMKTNEQRNEHSNDSLDLTSHNERDLTKDAAIQPIFLEFDDIDKLNLNFFYLKTSGWFYDAITCADAEILLRHTAPGTFLVRESRNSNFLFAITVQTHQSPTSIRIKYENGLFSFDRILTTLVPQFESVMDLLEYYAWYKSRACKPANFYNRFARVGANKERHVFYDESGTIAWPIVLKRPLRRDRVPSLAHVARLCINRAIVERLRFRFELASKINSLQLPKVLVRYLIEYPFIM